jgi:hypothetical protein
MINLFSILSGYEHSIEAILNRSRMRRNDSQLLFPILFFTDNKLPATDNQFLAPEEWPINLNASNFNLYFLIFKPTTNSKFNINTRIKDSYTPNVSSSSKCLSPVFILNMLIISRKLYRLSRPIVTPADTGRIPV